MMMNTHVKFNIHVNMSVTTVYKYIYVLIVELKLENNQSSFTVDFFNVQIRFFGHVRSVYSLSICVPKWKD